MAVAGVWAAAGGEGVSVASVTSLLVALGGVGTVVGLFTIRASKRKTLASAGRDDSEGEKAEADAASVLTTTAVQLLVPLREQLAEERRFSQEEIGRLRGEVRDLREQVDQLGQQLAEERRLSRNELDILRAERDSRILDLAAREAELVALRAAFRQSP